MGDDDTVPGRFGQRVHEVPLDLRVEGRCRFVQDEDAGSRPRAIPILCLASLPVASYGMPSTQHQDVSPYPASHELEAHTPLGA